MLSMTATGPDLESGNDQIATLKFVMKFFKAIGDTTFG